MKVSREAWNLKAESFGPLLPYVIDPDITDINFNGTDVWVEHLKRGIYKVPVQLPAEFVSQFSIRVSNVVSSQINKYNNVLEAETDILRISIIHSSATNTGYAISIRKTPAVMRMSVENMLKEQYCSGELLIFLINCIRARMNMVFCGRPGAGKTELLKFLTQYIPKEEKVMTIEDNLEIHYKEINPGSNCVELKVDEEFFPKYLLECFSTGLHGLTTLHTDDTRKIPDRIQNMMQDAYAATRLENDIYSFLNVGVLLRKKVTERQKVVRFIDQICLFDRIGEQNVKCLIAEDGKFISREIPENVMKKFKLEDITAPFSDMGSMPVNMRRRG